MSFESGLASGMSSMVKALAYAADVDSQIENRKVKRAESASNAELRLRQGVASGLYSEDEYIAKRAEISNRYRQPEAIIDHKRIGSLRRGASLAAHSAGRKSDMEMFEEGFSVDMINKQKRRLHASQYGTLINGLTKTIRSNDTKRRSAVSKIAKLKDKDNKQDEIADLTDKITQYDKENIELQEQLSGYAFTAFADPNKKIANAPGKWKSKMVKPVAKPPVTPPVDPPADPADAPITDPSEIPKLEKTAKDEFVENLPTLGDGLSAIGVAKQFTKNTAKYASGAIKRVAASGADALYEHAADIENIKSPNPKSKVNVKIDIHPDYSDAKIRKKAQEIIAEGEAQGLKGSALHKYLNREFSAVKGLENFHIRGIKRIQVRKK